MTQRTTKEALAWYRGFAAHPTFDPDGMCLMICRSARDIPARYPSAVSAQVNTPEQFRVYDPKRVKKGMIGYFDDPNDSNPYGHVATFIQDGDEKGLPGIPTWSNSVVANQMRIVPADFFQGHWGDRFQFAATILNGVELDLDPMKPSRPKPPLSKGAPRIKATVASLTEGIQEMRRSINVHQRKGETRLVNALTRDLDRMVNAKKHLNQVLRDYS